MPTVPLPNDQGPQVAPSEPQGGDVAVQVSPDDAIGRGLAKAGSEISDIGAMWKQKVDTIASLNADTAFGTEVANRLWDPKTGVTSTKGPAAAGRLQEAQEHLDDYRDQIASKLTDGTQRADFMRASTARMFQFQRFGGQHVAQQTEQADQDAYQGQLRLSTMNAVGILAHHGSDETAALGHEVQTQLDIVQARGQRLGQSPETIKYHQAAALTDLHDNIIDTMIRRGDVAEAKGWFDAHQDQMVPGPNGRDAVADKVNAAVQTQTINTKVGAAIDSAKVFQGSRGARADQVGQQTDDAKAFAALSSDTELRADPKLMARATQTLDAQLKVQKFQQDAADDQAATPLRSQILAQNGIITPDVEATMANMPNRIQDGIRAFADHVANPPETDVQTMGKIRTLMTSDPVAFGRLTSTQLQGMMSGKVDRDDQKDIVKTWTEIRAGKDPAGVLSRTKAVDSVYDEIGITKDGEGAGLRWATDSALSKWANAITADGKPSPSPDEFHDKAKQLVLQQQAQRQQAKANARDVPTAADLATTDSRLAWADRYAAKQPPLQDRNDGFPRGGANANIIARTAGLGADYHKLPTGDQAALQFWWGRGAQAAKRGDSAGAHAAKVQMNQIIQARQESDKQQEIDNMSVP